jgi:hypothetical protein
MSYLRRPSTYVIAVVAILAYTWVYPMLRGMYSRPAQQGS